MVPPETEVLEQSSQLLNLSAKDDRALADVASRLQEQLVADPALNLADVCFTAAESRAQMPVRLAVVARTHEQMGEQLRLFAEGGAGPGIFRGTPKRKPLAFLFHRARISVSRYVCAALPEISSIPSNA